MTEEKYAEPNMVTDPNTAGGLVTEQALPIAEARELVAAYEARGLVSSWAPDHDDRSRAWVYVVPA